MTHRKPTASAKALLSSLNISRPPIDVRNIATHLGITVAEAPNQDDEMSGLILRGSGNVLIGLNARHSENRKRFTLAHEIGHFQLHSKGVFVDPEKNFNVKFRIKKEGFDPEEYEANIFAAELLMPEDWIKKDFNDLFKNYKDIGVDVKASILSKLYGVSEEAMSIRLDHLSLA